jgi:hypothetical protein
VKVAIYQRTSTGEYLVLTGEVDGELQRRLPQVLNANGYTVVELEDEEQ